MVKGVTYQKYKIFTRMQEQGEVNAELTAQAAKLEMGTLENEIVRNLLISKLET